ncbi:CHAP domain-containing protein [Streptomyces reniochalinae]
MTVTPESVIKIAKGEVGTHEGYSNGHWNNDQKYSKETPTLGWSNYQAWCATFVSWVAYKAGAANLFPCTASCLTGVSWFKQRGRFSEYPAVGAQVFYGSGGGSHTGLVVAFDANTITTVEGNTNTTGAPKGTAFICGLVSAVTRTCTATDTPITRAALCPLTRSGVPPRPAALRPLPPRPRPSLATR